MNEPFNESVSPQFILSIDQGTTGTTANLIDRAGQSVGRANINFRQIFPQPGWVEHDPEDIWQSVLKAIEAVCEQARLERRNIVAIGITNQRETVVLWDRATGRPLYNAIVWQCRRTTDYTEALKRQGHEKWVRQKTGLVLDPYFSASKMRWLLKHVGGSAGKSRKNNICLGTIDTYLLWRLTAGLSFATDVSNASRTQLMNLQSCQWDEQLLKLFEVPRECLPSITHTSQIYGHTSNVPGLPDQIPIGSLVGDQQSALFGQACFRAGDAKCTFGTGSFILMNTGPKLIRSKSNLLTTVAWRLPEQRSPTYALEGGAFVCGAAVQWLRDGLGLMAQSEEVEELALSVPDNGGVEFVPALTGLGAPHWKPQARGAITGLTRGTTKGHVARATLEAMALQNADILQAMQKDLGRKMRRLRVDGGACNNNLLMQMQSDFLSVESDRPQMIETTSLGAAYLAGLAIGFWPNLKALDKVRQSERIFRSQMKPAVRRARLEKWRQAIKQL